MGFDAARALAETLLAHQRPELWERAQRAAIAARTVAGDGGHDRDLLMTAAVLHPIGHSPVVRRTGDPRRDAARFLEVRGYDPRVAELVAGRGPLAAALDACTDLAARPPVEPRPDSPTTVS
ncbi:HDOD domain-containing protein [Pseudonocardia sp. ICBG1293]|uniref:HDOD domain-containing protein n=1 Tax=Pseudonocardia sp. ICBG1293 TaxID=2844382 RepID=UPI001CCBF74B|nr:HDOD domain-containing protein [Pseudonocardia sp. ICBG1293]